MLSDLIEQLPEPQRETLTIDLSDLIGARFVYRAPDVLDIYTAATDANAHRAWQQLSLNYRGADLPSETVITLELMARLHLQPEYTGDLREQYMQLLARLPIPHALAWLQRMSDALKPYLPTQDAIDEKKDASTTGSPTT